MMKKPKTTRTKQAEFSRRGAAGLAITTAGRSRTIDSKKLYSRRKGKAHDE